MKRTLLLFAALAVAFAQGNTQRVRPGIPDAEGSQDIDAPDYGEGSHEGPYIQNEDLPVVAHPVGNFAYVLVNHGSQLATGWEISVECGASASFKLRVNALSEVGSDHPNGHLDPGQVRVVRENPCEAGPLDVKVTGVVWEDASYSGNPYFYRWIYALRTQLWTSRSDLLSPKLARRMSSFMNRARLPRPLCYPCNGKAESNEMIGYVESRSFSPSTVSDNVCPKQPYRGSIIYTENRRYHIECRDINGVGNPGYLWLPSIYGYGSCAGDLPTYPQNPPIYTIQCKPAFDGFQVMAVGGCPGWFLGSVLVHHATNGYGLDGHVVCKYSGTTGYSWQCPRKLQSVWR